MKLSAFLERLATVTKARIERAQAELNSRIAGVEAAIKAIPAGAKGDRGDAGAPGTQGDRGADGKSAYGIAVERGFAGTELQWLDSLKGEPGRGEKGDRGDVGPVGLRGERGDIGPAGAPGKDADPAAIKAAVAEAVASLPAPRDGKDCDPADVRALVEAAVAAIPRPQNGKDCDPDVLRAEVRAAVDEAVSALPMPKDGAPGQTGPAGRDGAPGPAGETGPRGEPGLVGRDGKDGAPGERGSAGERGADGKSVTLEEVMPRLEAAFAKWALEVERRAMDLFQRTADTMPVPKDGLSLEDLHFEHDGDGNVTFRFERGDLRKEFAIRLPRFRDKGVYRDGEVYREGDGVTYGGSLWLAQRDAPEGKPDSGNGHFRLAVKKGRDGKDGK